MYQYLYLIQNNIGTVLGVVTGVWLQHMQSAFTDKFGVALRYRLQRPHLFLSVNIFQAVPGSTKPEIYVPEEHKTGLKQTTEIQSLC